MVFHRVCWGYNYLITGRGAPSCGGETSHHPTSHLGGSDGLVFNSKAAKVGPWKPSSGEKTAEPGVGPWDDMGARVGATSVWLMLGNFSMGHKEFQPQKRHETNRRKW